MATSEPRQSISAKTVYTFSEAVEYMKQLDKKPTDINGGAIRWISVRTGKEIIIGYTR